MIRAGVSGFLLSPFCFLLIWQFPIDQSFGAANRLRFLKGTITGGSPAPGCEAVLGGWCWQLPVLCVRLPADGQFPTGS